MVDSILETWNSIKLPKNDSEYSAEKIDGTNAWIFKDHQGKMGFLLSGVKIPRKIPKLVNIEILRLSGKEIEKNGEKSIISNCLEVHLDIGCDPKLLSTILDRMRDISPSGKYSSDLLMDVLNQVIELVKSPPKPPLKEQIIGAWGEMKLLQILLEKTKTGYFRQKILSGWEANGNGRDIIDLRFPHARGGLVIEVKTTTSERKHHINGYGQITIPDEIEEGFIASIKIRETDKLSGQTTSELAKYLGDLAMGNEEQKLKFTSLLKSKLDLRGNECHDERYSFQINNLSLRFIKMENVPCPIQVEGVEEVEWFSIMEGCEFLDESELEEKMMMVTGDLRLN